MKKLTEKQEIFINEIAGELTWLIQEGFRSSPIRNLNLTENNIKYAKYIKYRPIVLNKINKALREKNMCIYHDWVNFNSPNAINVLCVSRLD